MLCVLELISTRGEMASNRPATSLFWWLLARNFEAEAKVGQRHTKPTVNYPATANRIQCRRCSTELAGCPVPQLLNSWFAVEWLMPIYQSRAWANWFRFLPSRVCFPDFCSSRDMEQYVALGDVMNSMLRVQSPGCERFEVTSIIDAKVGCLG